MAELEGVHISFQSRFEGFIRTGEKVEIRLKNLDTGEEFHVSVDVLVGADGTQSAVSRAASRDGHLLASLIQAKTEFREGVNKDTTQVWFDSNLTRYFSWLIPESDRIATVGLIADGSEKAEEALNRFLLSKQVEPLNLQAAPVPMHRFEFFGNHVAYGNNIFFVGDAGAQVKATTVGGVVAGLRGARALVNAILNGRNYHKELQGLKLELDLHLLFRRILNRFDEKDYDQLIGIIDGRLKYVLREWTRDEITQSLFKLILAEPRLITLGAKAFLKSILQNSN
jgi:flavin-dependent dehydrogenase